MGKLVSIEKLKDGKVKLIIKAIPKTTNHYNILIRHAQKEEFCKNIYIEELHYSNAYFEQDKQKRLHWHINLSKEPDAEYSIVFGNTAWVNRNIKDIVSQLLNCHQQILIDRALKNHAHNIATAIKTDNYVGLIQQMIIDNAENLSPEDLEEIRGTLIEVKQNNQTLHKTKILSQPVDELIN